MQRENDGEALIKEGKGERLTEFECEARSDVAARSHVARSHVSKSDIARSYVARSDVARSDVARSHLLT